MDQEAWRRIFVELGAKDDLIARTLDVSSIAVTILLYSVIFPATYYSLKFTVKVPVLLCKHSISV